MLVSRTKSVCPVCLRLLDAERRLGKDGNIYMEKTCPDHGSFSALLWEGSLVSYLQWNTVNKHRERPVLPKEVQNGCPYDCGLCASHQRKGCCVLLELTKRCNLSCPVCFADAGKEASDLSLAEIEAQYEYLMQHGGPFNIQLSGGEPTVRDDLPEIIQMGIRKGFNFFQLNTNGLRLAEDPDYGKVLQQAGLNTVFLQFDGLDDAVYKILRGKALLEKKQKAIANCKEAGLGVVLVPVIAEGVNTDQVGKILRFALDNMPHVRGVHFQPLSYFGRCAVESPPKHVTIPAMLRMIEEQTDGLMKASDFSGGGAENPYCSFHASFRVKPDDSLLALPKRSSEDSCCCTGSDDSRIAVGEQWSGSPKSFAEDGELTETSFLDRFLEKLRNSTLAISGMVFQDAYNFDLERVKRCHICEIDSQYGMVPFCAYNLTNQEGKALYRK